jgi:hypothetical protein
MAEMARKAEPRWKHWLGWTRSVVFGGVGMARSPIGKVVPMSLVFLTFRKVCLSCGGIEAFSKEALPIDLSSSSRSRRP